MSITYLQASDILVENWADWREDDPDWWDAMIDWAMEYPSFKALRRDNPEIRVPRWWPGSQREAK